MLAEKVQTFDGTLTAVRVGRGRDVVVLHSLLTDRHAFDAILPALGTHFRLTLINLPGFHGSTPVQATMDAYAGRIHAALSDFGIGRGALVIGNGFGGMVALAVALAHPKLIGRLLLCDVAAGFPIEAKQAFRLMANKVAAAGMASVAELATYRIFHPDYLASHPRAIEERRAVLLNVDPIAFAAACSVLVTTDLTAQLKSLRAATLVVCGERDQATPPSLNRQIAEAVPGARYVEIPGCGHCPPLEQPEAFLAVVRDFIGLPKESAAPSRGAPAPAPVKG